MTRYFPFLYQKQMRCLAKPFTCQLVTHRRFVCTSLRTYGKIFHDHENKFAFQKIVAFNHELLQPTDIKEPSTTPKSIEDLDEFLSKNWESKSAEYMCDTFQQLSIYCSKNGICISDAKFDTFIDTLTDVVKDMSDADLERTFQSLKRFPEVPTVKTQNYIEVWAALDDACLNRAKEWSIEDILKFAAFHYQIGIVRSGDFMYRSNQKLCNKSKYMPPQQLVQTMFYIGLMRSPPLDLHNIELLLKNKFHLFSIDDLAIIAMGFFKSKTPIRDPVIVEMYINKVIEHKTQIHEIALAAILKLIRYSARIEAWHPYESLLSELESEVDRLSLMCCVHLALVASTALISHNNCINKIIEKASKEISTARTKDLERIILAIMVLNYKHEEFCKKTIEELRKEERKRELNLYPRTFSSTISFLNMIGFYPLDLIEKVLGQEFLQNVFGKNYYLYGREFLVINNLVEIFCPEYKGPKLTEKIVRILSKKYTDFIPDENYQKNFNVSEKVVLDAIKLLREDRGGEEYVCGDHILTHYQRGDIIVCNDKSGKPVPISPYFPIEKFGKIQHPPNDNYWIVLIFGGRNAYIRNTGELTGPLHSKCIELETLGYHPLMISWSTWSNQSSKGLQLKYLNILIESAMNKRNIAKDKIHISKNYTKLLFNSQSFACTLGFFCCLVSECDNLYYTICSTRRCQGSVKTAYPSIPDAILYFYYCPIPVRRCRV